MDIKKLKIKHMDVYSMAFSGILYIALGMVFLTQKSTLAFAISNLVKLLVILFTVAAIFQIIGFTPLRQKRLTAISKLFGFAINLGMASILYFNPRLVLSLIPIAFGIYAVLSGLTRILIFMQYKKNQTKTRAFTITGAVLLIGLGIMIIIHPLASILPLSNIIGIFFLLYGISFVVDALLEGMSIEGRNSFKRRIRISLPVFMVAMIPHSVLMKINRFLESNDLDSEDLRVYKEDRDFDLEILIHVGEKGLSAFGHVDIWFEDKILTYGSYDEATYKFGGAISDGVLMEIHDKQAYIDFSQDHMGKTLFGFGLKLSQEQKTRVREKIDLIYENLYEWKPKSKTDEERGIISKISHNDYASIVYNNLGAKFYKFKKGPFKTYFALHTNCVLLADRIVGQAGIDIVKINGLISPGAYFEFFNREFSRRKSFVISRTIYYKEKSGEEEDKTKKNCEENDDEKR